MAGDGVVVTDFPMCHHGKTSVIIFSKRSHSFARPFFGCPYFKDKGCRCEAFEWVPGWPLEGSSSTAQSSYSSRPSSNNSHARQWAEGIKSKQEMLEGVGPRDFETAQIMVNMALEKKILAIGKILKLVAAIVAPILLVVVMK